MLLLIITLDRKPPIIIGKCAFIVIERHLVLVVAHHQELFVVVFYSVLEWVVFALGQLALAALVHAWGRLDEVVVIL